MAWMFSPTQINLFLANPEGWRETYLRKKRAFPSPGTRLGAEFHRTVAAYLRGAPLSLPGPAFTIGSHTWHPQTILAAGLPLLPQPGTVEVEVRRRFEAGGHAFVVVKDVEDNDLILDHKCVENLSDAHTPESLLLDPQAVLCAAETLLRRPDLESVRLRWVYYRRDGAGAQAVDAVLAHDQLDAALAPLLAACDRMAQELEQWKSRALTNSLTPSKASSRPAQTPLPIPADPGKDASGDAGSRPRPVPVGPIYTRPAPDRLWRASPPPGKR